MKIIPTDNYDTDTDSEASPSSISSDDIDTDPHLHHDVMANIAEYLCVEDLLRCRAINREWNRAMSQEFKKRTVLVISDEVNAEFLDTFNADRLITESLWIRNVNFFEDPAAKEWMLKYGPQLKSLILGAPMNHVEIAGNTDKFLDKACTIWNISSLISKCPNLKTLIIPAPFSISLHGLFKMKDQPKLSLDYLQFGCVDNEFSTSDYPSQRGSSSLLLNLLKLVKSLKCLKFVGLNRNNLDGINSCGSKDDEGRTVLENISELRLDATPMDPRKILSPPSDFLSFQNLQKLTIASFCDSIGGFYLPNLFNAVSHQLIELTFDQCEPHRELNCPSLNDCFPDTLLMHRLEIFRIIGITKWIEPSLDFLRQLPRLKILQIKVASFFIGQRATRRIADELRAKPIIYPSALKKLILGFGTDSPNIFNEIIRHFPGLESLETEYYGEDLRSVTTILSGGCIKDLKLYIDSSFTDDYISPLVDSGTKKFTIEFKYNDWSRKLFFDLEVLYPLGNLKPKSLRELYLIGMKVKQQQLEILNGNLSDSNIMLSLFKYELEEVV